jgi:tetratricopeptide (TPR) repeat protein
MDPNFPPDIPNVSSGARIPAARQRLVLVAAVALVAGAVAAAVVIATRGGGTHQAAPVKPLGGRPPLVLDLPGTPVTGGNAAIYAAARQRLPADDVRLAVARAIMAYNPAQRASTVAALRRLPQQRPVVEFALAMAQVWAGDLTAAGETLRRVKQLDPYGFYGTSADNLLYPSVAKGYPPYFPPPGPRRSLRALRSAVRTAPHSPAAWLALAAGLERTNRLAALNAAREAETLEPNGVSEQVAVAVLGFVKDSPLAGITTLGNLASQAQEQANPEVHFHLGLLYVWIEEPQDAAGEFSQVIADAPHSYYAKIARVFDRCINNSASCPATG